MKRAAIFLLLAAQAFGANHYIRAGASGTNSGASWANAFPTFAAALAAPLVRGDTYFVAGGNYTEDVYVNVTANGSWIYFKKANESDNGSDPGWNSSYATTVAVITGAMDLDKGKVSWDGVTGSGTSGHGIKFYNSSNAEGSKALLLENGTGPYSISHCEIRGSGFSAAGANGTQGIYYANFTNIKGVYFGYNWIHDVTINGAIFTQLVGTSYSDYGLLFENNVISETGGCTDPDKHGQGMQLGQQTEMGYIVIRNNIFRNCVGSAMIAALTSGDGANHHDWLIYNNAFYITNSSTYSVLSPGVIWHEPQGMHSGTVISNFQIYNNVFYGISGATNLAQIVLDTTGITGTGNVAKNNVWESCGFTAVSSGLNTEDKNGYYGNTGTTPGGTNKITNGSSSAFTNGPAYDFTLAPGSYALAAGANLTSTFTTYADGTARANSAFDLGSLPAVTGATTAGQPGSTLLLISP